MRNLTLALLISTSLFVSALSEFGFCQTTSKKQNLHELRFREIHVDVSRVKGTIRSFQGVNGTPTPIMEDLPDVTQQYKDLRIDMVRTHDTMGPTDVDAYYSTDNLLLAWLVPEAGRRAKLVAAGNKAAIFPDWNADPEKPESYNFGPSDKFVNGIRDAGAEVYYRIGRSWGADYTALPVLDKFASVVKHLAMHYNRGWAGGFQDNIRYWEFWNEPETPLFWTESPETFYKFYQETARALKSVDPTLKVGADAKALAYADGPYREGLINYCAEHKVPLDFYSWHHYTMTSADPYDFTRIASDIRQLLDDNGFRKSESILSEWNLTPDFTEPERPRLQGVENAAFMGNVLTYLQDSSVDRAHFYRADGAWMGLFGAHGEYLKPAFTFLATGKMLATPQRLEASGADADGFAVLAGRSGDGKTVQVLISNYEIPANYKPRAMNVPEGSMPKGMPMPDFSKMRSLPARTNIRYQQSRGYHLIVDHLPWGRAAFKVQRYRLTKTEDFALVQDSSGNGGTLDIANPLPPPALELIVLESK
jgi:xylan 1,4-beta-xylosidase